MGNIGAWELVIIVILVVVIFGGRKLPELGRGLGQALTNFRRAVREPDPAAPAEPPADQPAGQAAETPADQPVDKADSPPSGDGR